MKILDRLSEACGAFWRVLSGPDREDPPMELELHDPGDFGLTDEQIVGGIALIIERRRVGCQLMKEHFGNVALAVNFHNFLAVTKMIFRREGEKRWTIDFERLEEAYAALKSRIKKHYGRNPDDFGVSREDLVIALTLIRFHRRVGTRMLSRRFGPLRSGRLVNAMQAMGFVYRLVEKRLVQNNLRIEKFLYHHFSEERLPARRSKKDLSIRVESSEFLKAIELIQTWRGVRPKALRKYFGRARGTTLLAVLEIKGMIEQEKSSGRWLVHYSKLTEVQERLRSLPQEE